jgi:hypothetical protein
LIGGSWVMEDIVLVYFDQWNIIMVVFIILWIAMLVWEIKLKLKQRKEIIRLKKMNDDLKLLMDLPIKKARGILRSKGEEE